MKRFFLLLIIAALCLAAISCTSNENKTLSGSSSVTDDLNYTFYFDKIPERVITLAPNLTEMIFELGQGKKLIGNTNYCNYPPEAKSIAKIGDLISIDYEKVVQLKPDLIFITVEGNNKESYYKLKELGLKVFVSNPRSYTGIKKTIKDMGAIFDVKNLVGQKIKLWDEKINSITRKAAAHDSMDVMFIVAIQPLMLSGPDTFVNEFIKICGLKNIAFDSPVPYPVYNREEVLLRNPDYILMASDMGFDIKSVLNIYPEWSKINAIKNNEVFPVDGDLYFRPGPRFAEAVERLFFKLSSRENQYPNYPQ